MRNAADAEYVMVGWWPGDPRHPGAAFYAYAYPAAPEFPRADLSRSGARWDETLGEFILAWDDVRAAADPHAAAVDFARSVFRHACQACGWDAALPESTEGKPPPVR